MIFSSTCPPWFLGFDVLLGIIVAIVSIFVAGYAWHVYRFIGQLSFRWWSLGFASISVAHLISAFANYYLYARITGDVAVPVPTPYDYALLHHLGYVAYISLFLAGYTTLLLVAMKSKEKRLGWLFASMILLFAVAVALLRLDLLFELLSIILLAHICVFTVKKTRRWNPPRRLVLVGFLLILLSHLSWLFLKVYGFAYVTGHVLQLIGYLCLAGSLVLILAKR